MKFVGTDGIDVIVSDLFQSIIEIDDASGRDSGNIVSRNDLSEYRRSIEKWTFDWRSPCLSRSLSGQTLSDFS